VGDWCALALLFAGVAGAFVADVAIFAAARRAWPAARRGKAHAAAALGALAALVSGRPDLVDATAAADRRLPRTSQRCTGE